MPQQQLSYVIRGSLYLNITDRCTLACTFCPKTQGVKVVQGFDLTLDHRPTSEEIIAAIDDPARYEQIVFCGYGEPTLRFKVLMEVAQHIKTHGGGVRVNTDGLANLANKRNVLPEMAECVDSLSISLNAQNA
ncbi:MAG: TatD family nuclease-associated radical SAM protein, partial [Sedimenticola sp.]